MPYIEKKVYTPSVLDIKPSKFIHLFIDRINKKHRLEVKLKSGSNIIDYDTSKKLWSYIQELYNIIVTHDKAIVIHCNNTRVELYYGLGKNILLEKMESIDIKERSIKRLANVRRRMVVETKFLVRTKKVDTRIFNRKTYASSSNKGV